MSTPLLESPQYRCVELTFSLNTMFLEGARFVVLFPRRPSELHTHPSLSMLSKSSRVTKWKDSERHNTTLTLSPLWRNLWPGSLLISHPAAKPRRRAETFPVTKEGRNGRFLLVHLTDSETVYRSDSFPFYFAADSQRDDRYQCSPASEFTSQVCLCVGRQDNINKTPGPVSQNLFVQ